MLAGGDAMRGRPERILLFRSGRHLRVALATLGAWSPGCEVTVVARPEASVALDEAGVDASRRILYDRTPFFQPLPFITSPAGHRALAGRFDRVCVLWNGPDGAGQANVDLTAMVVAPLGYTAITPDGALHEQRSGANLRREVVRGARSIAVAACLGLTLFLPARILALARGGAPEGTK